MCDNWWGIALLDVVGKAFGRLIQSRLQQLAECELPDAQCGFRSGRSCTDQIFVVRQIVEKLYEHRSPGFLVFIDLRKAYDSIPREALWQALELLGAPPQLVQVIKAFHGGMTAQVRVGGSTTSCFNVNNGLRQRCCMAPVLFNLFFSLVLEKWHQEMARVGGPDGIAFHYNLNGNLFNRPCSRHQHGSLSDLEFADDAVLFALSWQRAQLALVVFHSVATSFGLTVSFIKTKVLACGTGLSSEDCQSIPDAEESVANVQSFLEA